MDKKHISLWGRTLTNALKRVLDEGHVVAIFALSRKMPRLLAHILESYDDLQEIKELKSLLEDNRCVITTEISIPFVYDKTRSDIKAIVLDDIIISGHTLQSVCSEIRAISGENPEFISLYNVSEIKNIKDSVPTSWGIELNDKPSRDRILSTLANNTKNSGLPIDMEFPILYINKKDIPFEDLQNRLKNRENVGPDYIVSNSFVQIQNDEKSRLFNNDFAKIRIFDTPGIGSPETIKIVGYAPNILSESQIQDTEFFKDRQYADIWGIIHSSTIETPNASITGITLDEEEDRWQKVQHRRSKSLNTMANYLLSLSMLMRQLNGLIDNASFHIDRKDVELLLGRELTDKCLPLLNRIISNFIVSPSEREIADIPSMLAPFNLINDFEINRTLATTPTKDCHDAIAEAFITGMEMERVFLTPDLFSLNGARNMHFLESFQSLQNIPKTFIREDNSVSEINRTIDYMIDNGFVIPTYEVSTPAADPINGPIYWRRYFRGSHLISQIHLNEAIPYKIQEDTD